MLLLEYKKGVAKKPYKTRVFWPPPSWEKEKGEKQREVRGQKNTTNFPSKNLEPEKRAGSCSTFLGPKILVFQICKKKIIGISKGSWWYITLGEKAMLERGQKQKKW